LIKSASMYLILSLCLFSLSACSDDSTSPEGGGGGDEPLAAGDIVTMDLTLELEVEHIFKKGGPAVDFISIQVQVEARIVEVTDVFLDMIILPMKLADIIADGAAGTVNIYDDPSATSWCCVSKRDAEGNNLTTTSGGLALTIQIGDSPTLMIGGNILGMRDDPADNDRLIPVLAEIPVLGAFFNGADHEIGRAHV